MGPDESVLPTADAEAVPQLPGSAPLLWRDPRELPAAPRCSRAVLKAARGCAASAATQRGKRKPRKLLSDRTVTNILKEPP